MLLYTLSRRARPQVRSANAHFLVSLALSVHGASGARDAPPPPPDVPSTSLRRFVSDTMQLAGHLRAYATASEAINWESISSTLTDQGKRELASLRSSMLELERAVGSDTSSTAAPDWEKYKKQLDASIVDKFQKAYSSTKVPAYEDKEVQNVAARFKAIVEQAQKISTDSKARVAVIEKELAQIQSEKKRLWTTTIDEELANSPELAKQIDQRVSENSFLVN